MKKKILFVELNLGGGGAEKVAIHLANSLVKKGYVVSFFLFYNLNAYPDLIDERINLISVHAGDKQPGYGILKVILKLFIEVARHDVVIAGLEGWPTVFSWFVTRIRRKPLIAWVHVAIDELSAAYWNYFNSRMFKLPYVFCEAVVCVSKGVLESLCLFTGKNGDNRWTTIYNPVPLEGDRVVMREKNSEIIVISAGRLKINQKGFDLLIKAHAYLIKAGLGHRLYIFGEGEDREKLEELVESEGVGQTVTMPGFVDNIREWYDKSTIFVLSSRFEGLPTVLVEAMGRGLPIIAADCRYGPREILDEGRYGELVTSGSVQSLADAMKKLLLDDKRLTEYSKLSVIRAEDFTPDKIVKKWDCLIRKI